MGKRLTSTLTSTKQRVRGSNGDETNLFQNINLLFVRKTFAHPSKVTKNQLNQEATKSNNTL